jgi:hypothetical protein
VVGAAFAATGTAPIAEATSSPAPTLATRGFTKFNISSASICKQVAFNGASNAADDALAPMAARLTPAEARGFANPPHDGSALVGRPTQVYNQYCQARRVHHPPKRGSLARAASNDAPPNILRDGGDAFSSGSSVGARGKTTNRDRRRAVPIIEAILNELDRWFTTGHGSEARRH